jgi:hypothetical protein
MKKLLILATAVIAAAFAGSAQAGELVLREPYSLDIALCNGHNVHLEGTQLLVGSEKRTPSGGFSLSFHVFPVDVRGVDPLTGTEYREIGTTQDLFVVTPAGGTIVTIVQQLRIQGSRGEKGYDAFENLHIVVGPDGGLRTFIDTFTVRC